MLEKGRTARKHSNTHIQVRRLRLVRQKFLTTKQLSAVETGHSLVCFGKMIITGKKLFWRRLPVTKKEKKVCSPDLNFSKVIFASSIQESAELLPLEFLQHERSKRLWKIRHQESVQSRILAKKTWTSHLLGLGPIVLFIIVTFGHFIISLIPRFSIFNSLFRIPRLTC